MGQFNRMNLEVLKPFTDVVVRTIQNAERLDTLEGKTICEVWPTGGYLADKTFPIIREVLRKQFPTINIIPYDQFPYERVGQTVTGPTHWSTRLEEVGKVLRGMKCDAVMLGNSG